jgi:hypothetical protein
MQTGRGNQSTGTRLGDLIRVAAVGNQHIESEVLTAVKRPVGFRRAQCLDFSDEDQAIQVTSQGSKQQAKVYQRFGTTH